MSASFRTVLAALAIVELVAGPLLVECSAQMLDAPLIRGVETIRWGDSRQDVLQQFGFPSSWAVSDSGVELTYASDIGGEPASLTFVLVQGKGMIAARYQFDLPDLERCSENSDKMVAFVANRYPDIVAAVTRLDPGSFDPCEAAQYGAGSAPVSWKTPGSVIGVENRTVVWDDPNSDSRILLRLGEYGLEMLFHGPDGTDVW